VKFYLAVLAFEEVKLAGHQLDLKFIVYGYSGVDLMLFVVVIVLQEQIHGLCFP
jgi:hypothetical protein